MPSTPTYGFRYPALSDDPNVPEDIQFLADDVEDEIERVDADITTQTARSDGLISGYAAPTQTGSGSLTVGSTAIIMTVSITDPGFSYYIVAGGSIGWAMSAATQPGNLFEGSVTIDSTVYNTNRLVGGFSVAHSLGAAFTQPTLMLPVKRSDAFAAFTGAKTVRLIARNSGSATMTIPAAGIDTTLTVRIVPA